MYLEKSKFDVTKFDGSKKIGLEFMNRSSSIIIMFYSSLKIKKRESREVYTT